MSNRTLAIGDIHGEFDQLSILWSRLPQYEESDTIVFLGDYIDRGPKSREVIEFVQQLPEKTAAKVVTLMGNHERMLLDAYEKDDCSLLLPPANGCLATFLSFTGEEEEKNSREQLVRRIQVKDWLQPDIYKWLSSLPLWYEDEHAIYVHAGLEGEGKIWFHPTKSQDGSLLWMREDDFWTGYSGKKVVFGHTVTSHLPNDHLNFLEKFFDDKKDVWFRGDLIGIDTGCGKDGFLSAVELPDLKVYESR